jgi:hypothetical protein
LRTATMTAIMKEAYVQISINGGLLLNGFTF